jgi:YbgC/YbaW family acyl-CoA thioester hydrolase
MGKSFTFPVTVEFEDVDSLGIAHHTRLIAYLERARVHLLQALGGQPLLDAACVPVLRDLRVRFHRPARLLDSLAVVLTPEPGDGDCLKLGYDVTRGADLVVDATATIAFFNPQTDSVEPVPAGLAAALEAWRRAGP